MKRRRLLLILLASVASITLAFFIWPREREPEYNGVPLSKWLERAGRGRTEGFAEAIKLIGTNALPGLVRAVDYRPSRWRYWLFFKYSRLVPKSSNTRFAKWLLDENRIFRAEGAVAAFGILGRDALPSLGDLQRIATRRSSPSSPASPYALSVILTLTYSNPGDFDEGRSR